MNNTKPILNIEDEKIDRMTIRRILKTIGVTNKLIQKANGEEALNYLINLNTEKPGVILLDLNMPRMNGREFLQISRNDPNLNSIPVIIMTTSDNGRDIIGENVVGYIVKPVDFEVFDAAIRRELEKLTNPIWRQTQGQAWTRCCF